MEKTTLLKEIERGWPLFPIKIDHSDRPKDGYERNNYSLLHILVLSSHSIMSATATAITVIQASETKYSLVYRGNAIDGWMSAFVAHTALKELGHPTRLYSIGGGRPPTDQQICFWKGTHVLLLDLSMDKESQEKMIAGGVLSVSCVDHHETAVADWPEGMVDTTISTVLQVWRRWYADQVTPFWIDAVNRISLWKQPLWDDRCLREVLTPIAHMRPLDALRATEALMKWMSAPLSAEFQGLMAQGQQRLLAKDQELMTFLLERGRTHVLQEKDLILWGLCPEWNGLICFVLENSDHIIDTNEAAHLVFTHIPGVQVFVNFRKKVRNLSQNGIPLAGLVYLYSARSTAFDLTTGDFFHGQKQSAGAVAPFSEKAPFVRFETSEVADAEAPHSEMIMA